jgi:glutathione synthase/RimK-type ligase-like ATP-grasp enzyme
MYIIKNRFFKKINNINNFIFIFLLFILFIIISLFYKKINKHHEHYKGLSKVNEFEKMLQKKYTKVDTNEKIVTQCTLNSKINDIGEEVQEENCVSKSYKLHFNTEDAVKLVKDKIETSSLLQKAKIPVPKFFKFTFTNNMDNIQAIEKLKEEMNKNKINYPIVLKQIYGTFGIDVFTHIDNDIKARETLEKLREKGYNELMCEEQIEGNCYRIFVFNNHIIDVIERSAPFIIGDGINNIQSLIHMRNKAQLEKGLFKTTNISESYIKDQGYNMHTILPKGKNLIISTVINMHNGANIVRIPLDKLPKQNIEIFLKTNKVLGITTSGIDFLSKDISVPYNKNNGHILEVNGTPDTEIHTIVSTQSSDPFNIYDKISDYVF